MKMLGFLSCDFCFSFLSQGLFSVYIQKRNENVNNSLLSELLGSLTLLCL